MRIMHIADLHLGTRQYGMAQREEDFYDALERVKDIAIKRNVNAVIVAGDMFDTPKPPAKAVLKMSEFVDSINKTTASVVGIEGNHDLTPDNYWLRVCGVWPVSDVPYVDDMCHARIAGINFCRSEELLSKLEAMADTDERYPIVVLHCGVAEMGAGFNPDLSLTQLAPLLKKIGCKYCALGHIHIPSEQNVDGIWFVQPGSLEMKSIDEPQEKGVEIVDFDGNGNVVAMERVNYPTRKVQFLDIRYDEDLNQLTAARADELKDSLVVAYVLNSIHDGVRRVMDWGRENGVMCRVIPTGDDAKVQKEYDRSNSMNLLKEAVEAFFEEDSEQYRLVMEILQTGNPRLVMERFMNDSKNNKQQGEQPCN